MKNCVCGHSRFDHDHNYGCRRFFCCDRHADVGIGRRGAEHDGITHQTKPCQCQRFTEEQECNPGSGYCGLDECRVCGPAPAVVEADTSAWTFIDVPAPEPAPGVLINADPAATLAVCRWLEKRIKQWVETAKAELVEDMLSGERRQARVAGHRLGLVSLTDSRRTVRVIDEAGLVAFVAEHYPTEIVQAVRPAFLDRLKAEVLDRGALIDRDGVVHDGLLEISESAPYPMVRLDKGADETITNLLASARISNTGITAGEGGER